MSSGFGFTLLYIKTSSDIIHQQTLVKHLIFRFITFPHFESYSLIEFIICKSNLLLVASLSSIIEERKYMGKYKEKYRRQKEIYKALKDDVSDLMIAIGTEDSEKYDETVEIILTYYYTTDEASNLVKHIDDINAKKGEQDNATQL